MTKAEIIKAICKKPDYRFAHDEMMRMTKKELLEYYPEYKEEVYYLSYKKGYFDGRKDEKEQMMKEAVDGCVLADKTAIICNTDGLNPGDFVKLIIIKN